VAQFPDLSEDQKKVLTALSERASDGYTLINRTGLTIDQLEKAIQELLERQLVSVQGDIHGEQLGRAYLWVPPDAQGKADYLLGKMMAY
jgi:DNA-binding MarR family transcriptional regulator